LERATRNTIFIFVESIDIKKAGGGGLTRDRGIGTKLIHSGEDILVPEKPLEVPIYLSAGFITPSLARIYLYSREANPTVTALEEKIAEIEGYLPQWLSPQVCQLYQLFPHPFKARI